MSGVCKKFDIVKQKRLITLLQCIALKVKKVLSDELQDDILELLSIFNAVPIFEVDVETKNELLDWTSHTKGVFGETSNFLNLLENYFKTLCQETGKQQLSKNDQCEEILFQLGKFIVEQTAKRNEERKSKVFRQIYGCQLSEEKQSAVFSRNDRPNYRRSISRTSFLEVERCVTSVNRTKPVPPATNQSDVHPMNKLVAKTSICNQQHPNRAEAMAKGCNHHEKENNAGELEGLGGGDSQVTSKDWGELPSTSMQSCDLSFSSQQDNARLSLSTTPSTPAAATVNDNYNLLLRTLAQTLLSSEVVNLTDWAAQNFSIVSSQDATDVLLELDEKQIISASDLSRLRDFFESIIRFDFVCIIDAFLLGDYSLLCQTAASKQRKTNSVHNFGHGSTSRNIKPEPLLIHPAATGISKASKYRDSAENSSVTENSVHPQTQETSERRGAVGVQGPQPTLNQKSKASGIVQVNHESKSAAGNLVPQQAQQVTSQNSSGDLNSNLRSEIANEYQSAVRLEQNHRPIEAGFATNTTADVDTAGCPHLSESLTSRARNTQPSSSNISTPSTLQTSEPEQTVSHFQSSRASLNQHLSREQNWPCSHYKRVGLVKFECCGKFWPCHRCHNNQGTCGQRKSHDAVMVKCFHCNTEQQCCQTCSCGTKFANYYCKRCKHLTGNDNFPYHCEKCETCRIHADRSFHCDVCGLCFDNEYRQYHIHDKCCICLKDAFTRCPILPCSHKFHKECVNIKTIHRRFIQCKICGLSVGSNYLTCSL